MNISDFEQYISLSNRRFQKAIKELSRNDLISLKGFLDMPENRGNQSIQAGRKSQVIQNQLSQLHGRAATLPTHFMNRARKMLPKEMFEKIKEAAYIDKSNAEKISNV